VARRDPDAPWPPVLEIVRAVDHDYASLLVLDAQGEATVLLLGETGTGKELLARARHDLSRRRERAFIRLSAAALPVPLIESELFGYEKGAFTGAVGAKMQRRGITRPRF
jgi:transcriptional regulator with GAF, ATPase, and Fis domain